MKTIKLDIPFGRTDFEEFFKITNILEFADFKLSPMLVFVKKGNSISVQECLSIESLVKYPDDSVILQLWPGKWRSDYLKFTVKDVKKKYNELIDKITLYSYAEVNIGPKGAFYSMKLTGGTFEPIETVNKTYASYLQEILAKRFIPVALITRTPDWAKNRYPEHHGLWEDEIDSLEEELQAVVDETPLLEEEEKPVENLYGRQPPGVWAWPVEEEGKVYKLGAPVAVGYIIKENGRYINFCDFAIRQKIERFRVPASMMHVLSTAVAKNEEAFRIKDDEMHISVRKCGGKYLYELF